MKKNKADCLETARNQLRAEGAKLRSIAHLIEAQSDTGCVPIDIDEIYDPL